MRLFITFPARLSVSFALTSFLLCYLTVQPLNAAQLYKWIDKDGNIRYSDTLPSEQKRKRFQTMSPTGRVLDTTEEAPDPDKLKKERAEKKRLEEEQRLKAEADAKVAAEKQHHDNVLLMTFTNEQEILEAQDERIAVIDSVIKLLKKNISSEQEKLDSQQNIAKKNYLDKGKEVPGGLAQKIEYSTEKVLSKQQQLELKLAERNKIKQQYARDLLRFRELKATKSSQSDTVN